jgi:hypothetical protein
MWPHFPIPCSVHTAVLAGLSACIVAAPGVRVQAQAAPSRAEWRLRVPVDSGEVRVTVTTRAASIEIMAPTGTFLLAFSNSSPLEELARAAKALPARLAATDAADTLMLGPGRFDLTELTISRSEGGVEAGYVLSGTNGAWGFRLPMSLAQSQALFGAMQGDSSFDAVSFPSIRKGNTPDGDIPHVSGAWLDFQVDHDARTSRAVHPRVPLGIALPAGGTNVKLWFMIDRTGRVPASSVRLIGVAPPPLARAARDALLSTEFRPAERSGSPVAEIVMQDFTFRP